MHGSLCGRELWSVIRSVYGPQLPSSEMKLMYQARLHLAHLLL